MLLDPLAYSLLFFFTANWGLLESSILLALLGYNVMKPSAKRIIYTVLILLGVYIASHILAGLVIAGVSLWQQFSGILKLA